METGMREDVSLPAGQANSREQGRGTKNRFSLPLFIAALALLSLALGYAAWTSSQDNTAHFSLEYDRFLKVKKETALKVYVQKTNTDPLVRVVIDRKYFQNVKLHSIVPQPVKVETGKKHFVFYFPAAGKEIQAITFTTSPQHSGQANALVSNGHENLFIRQSIFP